MADFIVNIASAGSEKVNADLNKILKAANATSGSITALAQVLNTSANSAAAFANKIGLSAVQTNAAIAKYRALKDAGADNANIFKALNQELGINATQYKNLVLGIKDVDRQTDAYTASLRAQDAAQEQVQQSATAQLLALQQINQAARQVQQALGAFAQQAVSEFIQFDDALTSVSAKSGIAKDQLGFLADAAQEVALTTSQSPAGAIRAADALIALGASAQEASDRLGVTAQLADALRTVGATIEQSAKVVQLGVSIYEKFGITAEDVGNKVAVLSDTTAAASSTGLDEFLQLFSKAGGLAAQLGISMDELLAAFGELRDAGQAPEVAATALKGLLSTTLASRDKLEELGLTVFKVGADGAEEFVGLSNIMQQIGEKGLTTSQIVDIFGKTGVAAAVALSENYQSVNDRIVQLSGTTDELAQKSASINSSIAGQIKLLQGSYQTALKDIGESLGSFTSPAVQATTALVNAFINADPFIKKFVGGIVGIGAGLASVVVALTGFGLALKAMEVAQVGMTIKTVASTAANAGYTISANAAAIANFGLGKSFAVAGVGAINLTQGVAAAGVAAGKAALAYVPLALAIAGVAATAQIVAKTFDAVDADAAQARKSTEGVTSALNAYRESVGLSAVETATASDQLSVIDSIFKLLKDAINNVTLALEFAGNNIEPFVNGIVNGVGFAAEAFADFIDVIPGVPDALVGALRSAAQGFKDFDFATVTEAQASRTEVAFDNLITNVNQLQDEYIALTEQGVKPGSEAALALAGALRVAADELARQQGLNEADAAQRDALVETIGSQILALQGSTQAQNDAGDSAEDLADAIGEIEKAYDAAIAALDQDIAAKLIAVNQDVTLSAEQREAAIADIERQGALDRIAILEQFIAQRKALTGLEEEEAQANAEAIVDLESEVSSIRLDISEKEAKRREEIEKELAAELERIEKERIAKEEALRQAAYDEEVRQIEALKKAAELAAKEKIDAQNAIIEALDDESAAIAHQTKLLELRGERQDIIANQRLSQIDNELGSLQEAQGLLAKLNDAETSINEKKIIREKLQRDGINLNATEAQIAEAIRQKEEERRNIEFEGLLRKQEQERISLALSQQQGRIDLRRQLAQAEIARIEAESLIVQTQLAIKAQERVIAFKELELAAKRREGAAESELIALQGEIDAEKASLEIQKTELPLAQKGLAIAQQQVDDARDAQKESEEIFTAQQQNLQLQQQAELQTAQDANREAAEQDRFAREQEGITQKDIQAGRQLAGATRRASGGLPLAIAPRPAIPLSQQLDTGAFALTGPSRLEEARQTLDTQGALTTIPQLQDAQTMKPLEQTALGVQSLDTAVKQILIGITELGTSIMARPPALQANNTFINEPDPMTAQVAVLQGQLRASRGV